MTPRFAEHYDLLLAERNSLKAQRDELLAALEPFSVEIFSTALSGNVQGDDSPVFGRNGALLTLGDFRRARTATAKARP